ncbi:hypothetical protein CNR27_02640 [Luteimonas chenhongjianii]|uniref:Uncharacterized protein n=1 Tax=Luteimonas chenhongjianii TaxID=2006110 RepID=A0A290XBF8_9GAMM|nr:hypothetical protein CNR27_02640 [Luteimonas chenhongjianii]
MAGCAAGTAEVGMLASRLRLTGTCISHGAPADIVGVALDAPPGAGAFDGDPAKARRGGIDQVRV